MGNMVEGLLEIVDQRIRKIHARRSLNKEEVASLLDGLPNEWEPHREHFTRSEVQDMLLDVRHALTAEERKEHDDIQEELDALIGSDVDAGGSGISEALEEIGTQ